MYRDTEFFKPFGFDRATFFITLILVSIGIIMVFSSSGIISSEKFGHPFHYLLNQLMGAGLGLSLILILMQINIPFYQTRFFVFGLLFLTLGLLVLCLVLPSTGATDRWIHILNFDRPLDTYTQFPNSTFGTGKNQPDPVFSLFPRTEKRKDESSGQPYYPVFRYISDHLSGFDGTRLQHSHSNRYYQRHNAVSGRCEN
jgi:hypothetical protein